MQGSFSRRFPQWPLDQPVWAPACDCARLQSESDAETRYQDRLKEKVKAVFSRLDLGDPGSIPEDLPSLPAPWNDAMRGLASGRNLILVGSVGTGKTTLVKALVKTLTENHVPIRGGYVPKLLASLKEMDSISDIMASLSNGKVVVLDDLDKMLGTVYEIERLSFVVNECMQKRKPLLVTTNLRFPQLHKLLCSTKYGVPENWVQSFLSRLQGDAIMVELQGRDFRRSKQNIVLRVNE